MFEPKPLTCQCCGAPINRRTMRCDYCGTQYERENNGVAIKYEVEYPNVHKICAKISVPKDMVARYPEGATEYSLRRMRDQIAEGLLGYMKISTQTDCMSNSEIILGEVRVVDPTFTIY